LGKYFKCKWVHLNMILVTGGTGLVGAHLLYRLVKDGERPKAIYRTKHSLGKAQKVFSYYGADWKKYFNQITWIPCDITDISALENAFEEVTYVYHAAALISFDPKDYKKLLQANVQGTANVVNAAIAAGVKKICYVSSVAALGNSIGNLPVTESTEWSSENNYGYAISKHLGEMEVWRASQEGVPVTIVNPGVIIGPGFWKTGSGLLFSTAWKAPPRFLPNGTGFVTVNDVVNALLMLMRSTSKNERFILVNQNWTYKKLMSVLARELGKKKPTKPLKHWHLSVLWRLDWCYSLILGKPRKLSKKIALLFKEQNVYDNVKLLETLPEFSYENLEQYLKRCCAIFLKEQQQGMSP